MIGELLQLSRENEELRKEIDALKAELEQYKKAAHEWEMNWAKACADLTQERETFLAEHDENVRLHTALEQEREKSEGLRGALEQLRGCARDCKACMEVSSEALLAAKDEGK